MSRCCCTTSPRGAAATIARSAPRLRCKLGPRFGLDPAETETVSWLVRHHLLLSSTAFKRDLADPKTIEDFVRQVQSPERLRLLLILTVVDIRAVGPGVWNDWKRTLLRTLVRGGRGAASPRPQAAWPRRDGRAAPGGSWPRSSAGKRAPRAPMPGACPIATGLPSRPHGSSPMRARSLRPKRISAMPSRTWWSRTTPTAARRGSASSRPTARPCSTASAPASPRRARTSSTRASTPRATAWRSTICWCSTDAAKPYADRRLRGRLVKSVEAALTSASPPPLPAGEPQRRVLGVRGRSVGGDCRPRVDTDDGGRDQCPRPPRAARRARRRDPRHAAT